MKTISVVLPVYNGEKFLDRCIKSILTQRNMDIDKIEILAINDGSSDNSLSILQSYQDRYPNTLVAIDQSNIGVAKTRNKAIALATGTYIMFIDQDDWFDPDYCKVFYDTINDSNLDVVSGGFCRPDSSGKVRQRVMPKKIGYGKYRIVAAWAKIHRTEFLRQHKIEFFNNRIGEDIIFTLKEIASTDKWKVISYCGYNWFCNEASVSNTFQKSLTPELSKSINQLIQKMIEIGDNSRFFQYSLIRTTAYCLIFAGRISKPEQFIKAANKAFELIEARFPKLYSHPIAFFGPRGEPLNVRIVILLFVLIRRLHLTHAFAYFYCKGE